MSVRVERPDGSMDEYGDEVEWADADFHERYGKSTGGPNYQFARTVYRFEVEPLSEALRVIRDRFSVEEMDNGGYRTWDVVRRVSQDAAYYRPSHWITVKRD